MNRTRCEITLCDEMARKILPCMRAELVYRLVYERGVSQIDVAKRLGVSRAAISQYLSKKRGASSLTVSNEMSDVLEKWAIGVMGGEPQVTICDLCRCAKKKFD